MKKVFVLLMTLGLVIIMSGAAFSAWFSDTETGTGNSFTAGTLDLTVNGKNGENVSVSYANLHPGYQTNKNFVVKNIGSIPGFVDVESVVVKNYENTRWEPEIQAGDASDDQGELGSVFGMRVMIDRDCDGWKGPNDKVLFDGMLSDLPGVMDADELLNPGAQVCINLLGNWWSTSNDNLAQSDSSVIDATFSLEQMAD